MKTPSADEHTMPVGKYLLFPLNYEQSPCEICGKCCSTDWKVELDADEFLRYKGFFEESELPRELQEVKDGSGVSYKLLPVDGKCIFLKPDNKCYIHGKHGPEAKSRTCRFFPLSPDTFTPRGMHLKISFVCPAILKSLLSHEPVEITRQEWDNDLRCPGTAKFYHDKEISWESFFAYNDVLSSLFLQTPYHVEQNLLIASVWTSDLYAGLREGSIHEFGSILSREDLSGKRQSLLKTGTGFAPQYTEHMNVVTHIAYDAMQNEFAELQRGTDYVSIAAFLDPQEKLFNDRDRVLDAYHNYYLKELPGFSQIIERYLLYKVLGIGIFTSHGVIYGINFLNLCYCFFRLYLLADIIFGNKELNNEAVLKAVSFVEIVFFHRRSMQFPQMENIFSKPVLSLLLLRL